MASAYPAWLLDTGIVWPIFAAATYLAYWLIRRELRASKAAQLAQFTALIEQLKPIQPNTNGGESLSDLHHKVDLMGDALRGVADDLQAQKEELRDHKSEHRWRAS